MAQILPGNELNSEIEKVFEKAEETLILISPYIKLHHRFMDVLKTKQEKHKIQIIIVFGKNENDLTKSFAKQDFDFFQLFPNIEIRYEKRLHAKFYANERTQILTSMNLYDFSQDQNIEAGIKTSYNLIRAISNKLNLTAERELDDEAWDYFERVIHNSDLLFKNVPEYEPGFFGVIKKFQGVKNEKNRMDEYYKDKSAKLIANEQIKDVGYCIRVGVEIPYNPKKPFCPTAFKTWSQFKYKNYPEQFCHRTGKRSYGKTSMAKPVLYHN
jgi:hypothetical protein